ncbi:hypothetical protein K491DRAFT_687967 [Lophiostoma macrostomum CBS 122681]|uniref:Uncharacterized protein n=1 Tax=Lophiostoma macrostomum CBS 122681 TaxID=1314788 RepID=A0A6A6TPH4_9PLEO|nr:hypothetical protein K491DRAFT_687967 [Lophiostoma macrostomum CBS 122681]
MSPYQHLFSTNAVLNVWRNLRNTRDQNDLFLTLQYQTDDVRTTRFGKGNVVETTAVEERDGGNARRRGIDASRAVDGVKNGKSIGFVVPWRSMQAQKRELREKEKELAEALVVLAGEVAFTELPTTLQTSLTANPLIQIRHLFAGLSRQLSKIELQMADNAPFAVGKNLYTGGEIARRFLPPIQTLLDQRPVPQRMIFELLMELKDMVFLGMCDCSAEVTEWELANFATFEELDDVLVQSVIPLPATAKPLSSAALGSGRSLEGAIAHPPPSSKRLLKAKKSGLEAPRSWLEDTDELLYALESLETTASAMSYLSPGIPDFLAKSIITLRRMLDRSTLTHFTAAKKRRTRRCAEYARCMKWAGTSWRQGGGCRRGCKNEDEDPEALPSWHSSSRHFERRGVGTYMVGSTEDVLKIGD